ncbi:MAG: serine O-acetyltransferase EpsC [Agathobacter sp.]|nr:serine O-acetyltransferase EpsC [Agathobacter sp.]
MKKTIKSEIDDIVSNILEDYNEDRITNRMEVFTQPDTEVVLDIMDKLIKIIYPGYYRDGSYRFYNINSRTTVLLEDVMYNLNKQIALALPQNPDNQNKCAEKLDAEAQEICLKFFRQIPKIREYVETDVEAFFDGDPAAYNYNEIILCYPGLLTITIYRIAHELYLLKVPLIPRMMTEYAHSKTGIDIHPGATIGKYFFIDHGTGIVVGETTIIGDHVKVYQGVTIGALSTKGGQRLKGVKRHPTIEDNVIIYAGASILGGETVIGKGAVIGSNAFITNSIEEGSRVSIKNQELNIKTGKTKNLVATEIGEEPEVVANDMKVEDNWFYII